MFLDSFFALTSAFVIGSIFKEEFSLFWALGAVLASLFPDIDALWEFFERGKIWGRDWKRHRISFFHYPIFYAPFFLITFFFLPLSFWLLLLVNLSFHFFHDFWDGEIGIRYFYPFSKKFYALHRKDRRWVIVKRTEQEAVGWLHKNGNKYWIRAYFKKFWLLRLGGTLIVLAGYYIITHGYYPVTRADIWEAYYTLKKTLVTEIKTKNSKESEINREETNPAIIPENKNQAPIPNPVNTPENNNPNNKNTNTNSPEEQETTSPIPNFVNNHMAFISQAPLANWDALHEEACEEAALLIGHYYLSGKESVSPKDAEKDIQELSAYTKTVYPKKDDANLEELKRVAQNKFGYTDWKITENPKTSDIQKEVAEGNGVIMPLAGREINNPNFKRPGPLFHMLIVSGYDNKKGVFITQDPGTRKGKNYEYKFNVLIEALHDFPGKKEDIKKGVPRILIVKK
jgi:hypothetical protein